MSAFADKIKQLRNSKKLSMDQLATEFANRYDSKISKSSISRWENGQAKPDIDDASLYADYFGVTLDSLLDRQPSPKVDSRVETIAAHIDEDTTEEEMEIIQNYIEFIKTRRK